MKDSRNYNKCLAYKDPVLKKIEEDSNNYKRKIQSIANNYHDRLCMSVSVIDNQICKCCSNIVTHIVSIEHDSQDHSKDLGVCSNCYSHIVDYWKKNKPGKIAPI